MRLYLEELSFICFSNKIGILFFRPTPATKSFASFHISTEYNVGRNAISDKCISSQGKRLKFGYMVINIIFLLKIFLGENKSNI